MAVAGINHLWLHLLILMSIFAISQSGNPAQCVYTLYIRTGAFMRAGTDSKITATFYDTRGNGLEIGNLVTWGGAMGPGHRYFQEGNLDIFSNQATCLPASVCALNLTSDGSGASHGWYCEYVELTTTAAKKSCAKQLFAVDQWLARDSDPYELTAVRDNCGTKVVVNGDESRGSPSLIAKV